jgi:hypothetical protein
MRSVWADAMNAYLGRASFDEAFRNNQNWATRTCPYMYGDGGSYPPCWGDNTVCGAGSTCSNCCNMAYNVGGTQCGGSPWSDGTICAIGTTCYFCESPQSYWWSLAFTACGSEPTWSDGTVCALGTTCNACTNAATYWWGKAFTACGSEPCWGWYRLRDWHDMQFLLQWCRLSLVLVWSLQVQLIINLYISIHI